MSRLSTWLIITALLADFVSLHNCRTHSLHFATSGIFPLLSLSTDINRHNIVRACINISHRIVAHIRYIIDCFIGGNEWNDLPAHAQLNKRVALRIMDVQTFIQALENTLVPTLREQAESFLEGVSLLLTALCVSQTGAV